MKRTARFRATVGVAVALGIAIPGTANAYSEYFFSFAGSWGWMTPGFETHGNRHSLTRISMRIQASSSPWACVWGADGNNVNVRNTSYYCATSSDLAEVSLGGILRYPWAGLSSGAGGGLNTRALSEW
jgi:hypothetical protein